MLSLIPSGGLLDQNMTSTDLDKSVVETAYARWAPIYDAVCGPVSVDDWRALAPGARATWARRYCDADGHRHVHGANLGVAAHAYLRAGGFPPLACSEDVALVDLLIATGATLAWSAAPRVVTSGRLDPRVRGGFGDTLATWADGVSDSEPSVAP